MADDAASAPPTAQLAAASISPPSSSDLEPPTSRTRIRAILDAGDAMAGERVVVGGWVKTGRQQGKGEFAFLEVNDGSCQGNLQVMVDKDVHPLAQLTHTGTSVLVEGVLKKPPQEAKQRIELKVERVIELGEVDAAAYPLPKTKITLETLRDFVHLRARTNTIGAIARIRHQLAYATHSFFDENGFLYIHTPIITTSDCEGAGEMFQVTALFSQAEKVEKELKENPAPSEADIEAAKIVVKEKGDAVAQLKAAKASKQEITAAVFELQKAKENVSRVEERSKLKPGLPLKDDGKIAFENDFFKRQAFLTVSGQLQVETYACALSNVYTFGPTFRAENSHTSRHLAEFWMVEPEIAFANLQDDMNCAEKYVQYLCKWLLKHCREDMEFMVKHVDKAAIERLELVSSTPFERISYTKAVEILEGVDKKFENKVEWGIDLASEHERYLTEVIFKKPVIVYNYPKGIKAFYMRLNDDQKTVAAMDVLVPKVGELIGGSQREERLDILTQRILDADLPLEPYGSIHFLAKTHQHMAAMTITASSFLKTSFPAVCLPTATHAPSRASTRRVAAICNSISSSTPPYDLNCFKFNPMKESVASREMTRRYMTDMIADVNTDVIIIGTGSAGLSCAYELSKDPSVNIAIVERSVSPGGSGWLGSQLFSAMVVRKPAHLLLDELNIEYDEQEDYVVIKHAALFTSTLLSRLLAQPNVKLFNAVVVEDLVVKENRVAGVITNWASASMNQDIKSHIDPNVMEAKIVVSSCGHEGLFSADGLKRLEDIGTINTVPGMKVLDVNTAEDAIVSLTREVVPGMIVAGIEVAEIDGPHRMLPTFGATIISGQKAAHLALKALGQPNDIDEQRYSRESGRYTRRRS